MASYDTLATEKQNPKTAHIDEMSTLDMVRVLNDEDKLVAQAVEKEFRHLDRDITIAVMGCVVNGPGEARDADIALCGGDGCGALYVKGRYVRKLEGDLTVAFIDAVKGILHEL